MKTNRVDRSETVEHPLANRLRAVQIPNPHSTILTPGEHEATIFLKPDRCDVLRDAFKVNDWIRAGADVIKANSLEATGSEVVLDGERVYL